MKQGIILHTKNLAVGYNRDVLIPDITFSVNVGEILVLIGPNGAGKSTILKTITSQLKNVSGTVFLEGRDMQKMKEQEIACKMSLLMTKQPSPELMTVEDMVSTGRYPYTGRFGIMSRHDKEVVAEALTLVDLENIRDKDFNQISDGQRQRVMLARAICQEPDILVMDEPTSYLDIHHKLELLSILKQMVKKKQIAVILSLHELDLAQKCADHLLCIKNGQVDCYGTPDEIFCEGNHYIQKLYDVKKGAFLAAYGSLELERPEGEPKVFVIGGGGDGIAVYRSLQRMGVPFAAGVLHENDMDYPVAKALAAELITEKPFEPISDENISKAKDVMNQCERVVCVVKEFGTMNRGNGVLMKLAEEAGKLEEIKWQK